MKTTTLLLATSVLALSAPVLAQAPPPPPPAAAPPAAPPVRDTVTPPPTVASKPDRGAFVAGAKVGAVFPLDTLSPMVSGVVEVGYVFPFLKRSFGLMLDVAYTVPTKTGSAMDARVDGGSYTWKITQRELSFSPAIYYRLTMLGRVVPYVGVGPRIYLQESLVQGNVGMTPIATTTEQSTQIGVLVPVGVGIRIGPGEILGEFLFEYGKLDHTATGNSTSMGANVQLGYRFLL